MKRLYEMGGDITAEFFGKADSSMIKPGKRKKIMLKTTIGAWQHFLDLRLIYYFSVQESSLSCS